MIDRNLNLELFPNPGDSTKMSGIAGLLESRPTHSWRAALEENGVVSLLIRMVDEVKSSSTANDQRMRELTAQFGSLDGQIRLLNSHLERYNKLPERLERVERFIWAGSLVIGFVGVMLGGVGQRLIADAVAPKDIPKHEEYLRDRPTREIPAHSGT